MGPYMLISEMTGISASLSVPKESTRNKEEDQLQARLRTELRNRSTVCASTQVPDGGTSTQALPPVWLAPLPLCLLPSCFSKPPKTAKTAYLKQPPEGN